MTDLHIARKAWLDGLYGRFSDRDKLLLDRASTTLVNNVCVPEDGQKFLWDPYRGICPSPTAYKGVWNWDSAFHLLAVARWDKELAFEQAYIFCDKQLSSGMFPDVIFADGRVVDKFSKPPVFPWACEQVHKLTGDNALLKKVYPVFKKMEAFWWNERGAAKDGLFHYGGTEPWYESGWDDSVRWDDYKKDMRELWPIDLNCYMVMYYRAMQYMAGILGEKADIEPFKKKELALIAAINDKLWDKKNNWYVDTENNGKASTVLSPASFMPLFAKVAPKDRGLRMAEIAADQKKFFPGMPTVSYDDPKYNPAGYWRGPSWLNTNYFAAKGLKNYGYDEVADKIKETALDWAAGTKDALHEYYDTKTGKGIGASNFGWTSAFIIEYILNY